MKRIIAKKLTALLTAATLIVSLAACSTSSTGTSSLAAINNTASNGSVATATTVRMWTFLDPANTTNGRSVALTKMIKTYEAAHKGVTVKVEPQDYNIMTAKFLAATSSGDAPDIIWCSRDELPGVLNAEALEPLENLFLGDWSKSDIADIDDGYYKYGERDGKHYTLALSKNTVVLYYRADLFKAANLKVPTTLDELVSCAKALTGKDENTGISRYGLGQSFSTESSDSQIIANMILAKQGDLFNKDGTANWNTAAGKEALDWTTNCINLGITPKESANTSNEDLFTEFEAGKYAMVAGGGVRCSAIKAAASCGADAVQITAIPGNVSVLDGWFAGVWSGSKNKKLAGEFLETMYSPESDLLWVKDGGQAPVRKSTLSKITIDDSNKYLSVLSDTFSNGWFPNNTKAFSGWKFDLNAAVQDVLVSGSTSEKALAKTAEKFNTANKR